VGRLEWAGAAVSAVVVAGMIVALLAGPRPDEAAPPDLVARVEAPARPGAGGALVRFTIENGGGRAAEGVVVALHLGGGGDVAGRVTIERVVAGGSASGGFLVDPGRLDAGLAVRVEGYVGPGAAAAVSRAWRRPCVGKCRTSARSP
jgi:uncharacterized protein (TIGR02588 family)